MTNNSDKITVYEIVTLRILDMLEQGEIPWQRPYLGGSTSMPRNLITNKEYRGINRWLLWGQFDSPYYLTFNQAKELGGNVRKGEKASMVTYWNKVEAIDKATGEKTTKSFLRYYNVFNVTQCENLKHARLIPTKDNGNVELVKPSKIVKEMPNKPTIKHDSPNGAYYIPSLDAVHIGTVKQFTSSESYHATLFHELIHSTGHKSRLDRELVQEKVKYSREELIAEFGSAFLCEVSGISKPTIKNATAYIQHWRQFIESDVKAVVSAASKAEKACDYILGTDTNE
jgi:antirestriction protein ArdC